MVFNVNTMLHIPPVADMLTAYQVARTLGLTRVSVCRAVREGRLVAAAKLPGPNGAYLFTAQAVEAWRGSPLFELAPVA